MAKKQQLNITDFISAPEGARRARVTLPTMIAWCSKYGIGHRVGGRWRIDPDKLDKLLLGDLNETNQKK